MPFQPEPNCPKCRNNTELVQTDEGTRWFCDICGHIFKHNELQRILYDLRKLGFSHRVIGDAAGATSGTVGKWWAGHHKPHHVGPILEACRALLEKGKINRAARRKPSPAGQADQPDHVSKANR